MERTKVRTNAIQRKLAAVAVGALFASAGSTALASGFQLQEQGASGLGVAYSGQAAAVHDASTVFWNPAGMSLLPGKQGVAALHYVMPDTKYTDGGTSTFAALGNGGQGGEDAWVPALYGTWMINPQWSVGLAVNGPFGLATEWDAPTTTPGTGWAGQFHAIRSEIKTLNINPTVAFKVNNMLSLGAGLSYQRLEAELTQAASPLVQGSIGKVDGDDWAWGWNIGALINLGPATRVGLTYRSTVKYTVEGDLTFNTPALAALQSNVKADIKLPDVFAVGVSHQINQQTRILADWTWTGWDSIQNLDIVRTSGAASGQLASRTALNFDSSWRLGVGVEYQLNQPWLLRAGVAYDTTPVQDAFRTPRLPDENRWWLAIGARYMQTPTSNWWLDFGYTHIFISDASSNLTPNTVPPGNLVGSYEASVDILAAQIGFKF
jgi:long-chain fatty acid transport protein